MSILFLKVPKFWLLLAASLLWLMPAAAQEVFRVATYNLENYLLEPIGTRPVKTPEARAKVRESIRQADADILALQEIGGRPALMELREALRAQGLDYPHWEHVTGFDTNIQVSFLSRFPIVARHPHTNESFLLFGSRYQVSRGFAEIEVEVRPGYGLTLLTGHLKSKRPVAYADEAELREEEALALREIVNERLQAHPQINLVVMGDFNDTKDSRPIRQLIGVGKGRLVDTRPAENNGDNQPNPNPRYDPRNITWTHYYGKEDSYSRIDYILISRGLAREWNRAATRIVTLPNWGVGSDHRPIVATFFSQDR